MFTPCSLFVLTCFCGLIGARADVYSTAGLSTTWIATTSAAHYIQFPMAKFSMIQILVQRHNTFRLICRFYSQGDLEVYYFGVFIIRAIITHIDPVVLWTANQNRPVGTQATLKLTQGGDLVLRDADMSVVWSTKTSGKSVAGLNLTDTGNLVLFDENNAVVWQSYHFTDELPPPKARPRVIVTSSLGSFLAFVFLVVIIKCLVRNKGVDEVEEDEGVHELVEVSLDQIPGAPKRFTYDDLKAITEDFSKRLGQGGFSFVYQGTFANGTKVAVKQLSGLCQPKKSFLTGVESIGNIHHVNLVRLIGFCAENFHKLLVYEYMSKGSLDKWIFHKLDNSLLLDWHCNIANSLRYLHEECRWKIVHMDIKPQNILLDVKFNAKVADFGLSKLIEGTKAKL